jgi:hypothetical protein
MKNINKFCISLLIISISIAGTGKSIGTAGGSELLIPTGGKGVALNGANAATVSGADALFYNPAGISNLSSAVESQFANTNYIADIGMSYLAFATNMGTNTYALSVKSFDFGDIDHTTALDPTGASNKTFSPQFITVTAGFSKAYTDRIRFGSSLKFVNETIMQTNANGVAIDLGVQYTHVSLPLNLGIALKNLGPKMQYSGGNLEQTLDPEDSESGTITENFQIVAQPFDLPASLNISLTYEILGAQLHGTFTNNAFGFNQINGGLEYSINIAGVEAWIGGSTSTNIVDDDTEGWDDDITKNNFGASFGGGFKLPLGAINLGVDYGLKTSDVFGDTGVLAFNIGF